MDEPIYRATHIVCPACGNSFENNKINGIALIQTIQNIDARKRMYCKLSLNDLERLSATTGSIPFNDVKKIILDNFNDFVRDIQTIMGLGEDAE
jgi:hypothetical protein